MTMEAPVCPECKYYVVGTNISSTCCFCIDFDEFEPKEEDVEHHDDLDYILSEIAKARYRYNECLNPDEKKIETDIEMFKHIMKIYGA